MIEINLLPQNLKNKAKKSYTDPKYFLYLGLAVLSLLIALHLCLGILGIFKGYALSALNNKWKKLEEQRKSLAEFKEKYDVLSADGESIGQLLKGRISWAEKLNKLSRGLPAGIWFNEISVSTKNFYLKGSAMSLTKEEMSLMNKFIENLKNDQGFFKDFSNLELSSVQRRIVGGYEVVDFVLAGTLK